MKNSQIENVIRNTYKELAKSGLWSLNEPTRASLNSTCRRQGMLALRVY